MTLKQFTSVDGMFLSCEKCINRASKFFRIFQQLKTKKQSIAERKDSNRSYEIGVEMEGCIQMFGIVLFCWSTINNEISDTSCLQLKIRTRIKKTGDVKVGSILRLIGWLEVVLEQRPVGTMLDRWNKLSERTIGRFH